MGDLCVLERCNKMGLRSDYRRCGAMRGVLSGWSARSLSIGAGTSFWWQIDALLEQTQSDINDVCGDWR